MAATEPLFFNPLDPAVRALPYPHYAGLRELDPVHRSPFGMVVLTRYDDCTKVLRDARFSKEIERHMQGVGALFDQPELPEPPFPFQESSMLNLDPPAHTRLRALAARAFTPRAVEAWRPRIGAMVDAILDEVAASGGMDLVPALAFPLPFQVISEMLGMPTDGREELRSWSQAITRTLEPVISAEEGQAARHAMEQMLGFVVREIEARRRHPGDDLLSALVAAEEAGDRLSTQELIATVMLLYLAGHETTVNLIGTGTLALLAHPDQLERLRVDHSIEANAVDELLRFDGPVQFTVRVATEPVDFHGEAVDAGTIVMPVLGAANHDPAVFSDPDSLDLGRADAGRHLAFGSGIHFCLGATLARVEAQEALGRMVRRFPRLAPAGPPVWADRITLRGPASVPLEF